MEWCSGVKNVVGSPEKGSSYYWEISFSISRGKAYSCETSEWTRKKQGSQVTVAWKFLYKRKWSFAEIYKGSRQKSRYEDHVCTKVEVC